MSIFVVLRIKNSFNNMVRIYFLLMLLCLAFYGNAQNECIKTVPFTSVHINDSFWGMRLDTIRSKTIRYAFKRSEKSGYVDNFAIAGGLKIIRPMVTVPAAIPLPVTYLHRTAGLQGKRKLLPVQKRPD